MTRTWRTRRGLRGSATEDAILALLEAQGQPHTFTINGRTGNCRDCGLAEPASVHARATATTSEQGETDGR